MTTKIVFPTDDGETISRHFGRAAYFQVVTLAAGTEPEIESRSAATPGGDHGGKFAIVQDCDVLIGAGMGDSALNRLQAMGLQVILTGEKRIADALAHFQAGSLTHDPRRAHAHHQHGHDDDHDRGSQSQPMRFVDSP